MTPFEYVAWFEDTQSPVDDQEREWPAVFIVVAPDAGAAQTWGDELATNGPGARPGERFLWSSAEPHVCTDAVVPGGHHACANYSGTFPVVRVGEAATDEHIGW